MDHLCFNDEFNLFLFIGLTHTQLIGLLSELIMMIWKKPLADLTEQKKKGWQLLSGLLGVKTLKNSVTFNVTFILNP